MDFPLRVIVALVVIGAFAGIGAWGNADFRGQ